MTKGPKTMRQTLDDLDRAKAEYLGIESAVLGEQIYRDEMGLEEEFFKDIIGNGRLDD